MFRSSKALLAASILLGSLTSAQAADTGTLSLQVPLFKTKAKGDVVKFTPFKSAKDPFLVTVALYDADSGEPLFLEDGTTPWTETFTVTANNAAPSDPANGDLREPAKITGATTVVLGSTVPLPPDLLERDVLFSTVLTVIKKGQELPPFEESPRRPLGLDGTVAGQALAPASVTTEALTLTTGAKTGFVLTSDADGTATWQELPEQPGVQGTVNRLAVFDSATSLGDSNIADSGNAVTIDVPTSVTGSITSTLDVIATDDLSAGDDLFVGDNILAPTGDLSIANVNATGNLAAATLSLTGDASANDMSASGFIRTGTPSSQTVAAGDIAATDDLIADDDVFVGDDIFANGSGSFGGSLSGTSGSFTAAVSASGNITSTGGALVTGTPSTAFGAGDIVSTSDVFADGDVNSGDDMTVGDQLFVIDRAAIGPTTAPDDGDLAVADDLHVGDDGVFAGQVDVNGTFISNLSATNSELQFRSNGDQVFIRDFALGDSGLVDQTEWWDGASGFGGDLEMLLNSGGTLSIDGSFVSGGADLAEWFPTVDNGLEPGTLIALDPTRAEHVLRAEFGRHEVLLGVVPTEPGLVMGNGDIMGPQPDLLRAAHAAADQGDLETARQFKALWRDSVENQAGRVAVALQGRVPVQVDLTGGAIFPGDRLGMSARPGYAARYTGYGPVVGLAMEGYDGSGEDAIIVFLGLDHSPDASSSGGFGAAGLVDGLAELERATTITGQGVLDRGTTSVVVQDTRLGADSLPVITFYGDPGGPSWVSERGQGWFVLELAEPTAERLEFGFTATP